MPAKNNTIKRAIKILKSVSGKDRHQVIDYLGTHGKSTTFDISKKVGESPQWVHVVLTGMVRSGVVKRSSNKRNSYYTIDMDRIRKIESLAEAIINVAGNIYSIQDLLIAFDEQEQNSQVKS